MTVTWRGLHLPMPEHDQKTVQEYLTICFTAVFLTGDSISFVVLHLFGDIPPHPSPFATFIRRKTVEKLVAS